MVVPTLPELFVMGFFAAEVPGPSLAWGATLLAVVMAAEVTGTLLLFLLIRRFGLPEFLETRMRLWVQFLVVHDERIILVNRVAPVVPFLGAFIATLDWDLRRCLTYVVVGGAVKYSVLLAFVAFLFVQFDPTTASNITLIAIVSLVGVSLVQGQLARKRHLGPVAAKVAHLGDRSAAPSPPAPKDD